MDIGRKIRELRKERGITQEQLADVLGESRQAISKWETGISIPDTTMLIPLADLLGVTVTELLACEKLDANTTLETSKVENILKATITYSDEEQQKYTQYKKQWSFAYIICLLVSLGELLYCHLNGYLNQNLLTFIGICAAFGGYFCIFAKPKLPTYYDDNRINLYSDGLFRMNVPGVAFNNTNWPHILHTLRIWSVVSIVLYPAIWVLISIFLPDTYVYAGGYSLLFLTLAGMIIPIYVLGKKYE